MRKKIIFIALVLSLFLFNMNVDASCTATDKEKANDVTIKYEVKSEKWENKTVYYYEIILNNYDKDKMKAKLSCNEKVANFPKGENVSKMYAYYTNCNADFVIYDVETGCVLRQGTYLIPSFNIYSQKPICKKYNDYKYCQETYNEYISPSVVKEKIEALEKKDPSAAKSTVGEINNFFNKIFPTLTENTTLNAILIVLLIVLTVLLVIVIVTNIIIYKKKTKK